VDCYVGRAVTSEEGGLCCALLGRREGEFGCLQLVGLLVGSKGRLLACWSVTGQAQADRQTCNFLFA